MTPVVTIDGVNFYEAMVDGSQTAEIRAVQASMYMNREFVHGLPLDVAQELYTQIINSVHADSVKNETKLQTIAVLIHNLQVRIANVLNTDNLLGLACIYFYIDGEDPASFDGRFDRRKYDLMKRGTPEQQLFFCNVACKYTPKLKEISEFDLAVSLKEADNLIHSQRQNIPT